ncbi:hypothetical protein D3C78_1766810 [compost metagenome]
MELAAHAIFLRALGHQLGSTMGTHIEVSLDFTFFVTHQKNRRPNLIEQECVTGIG